MSGPDPRTGGYTPRAPDDTPEGSAISPTDKAVKAIERKALSAAYRVAVYAIGALAVGGTGIGLTAHNRISDEHDQGVLNTQAIHALEDAMRMESEERKAESIRTNSKLDELLRLILDRDTNQPTNLGRSR